MRLLDLIAQSLPPYSHVTATRPLPAPHHFAQAVKGCQLRLVLADDLTRCSTVLAYAEGSRLSRCLDRVRVPRERLWVEWSESPRVEALSAILETHIKPPVTGGRAGVLIHSDPSGRRGTIRSFRSTRDGGACCVQLITEFDLDLPIRGWNHAIAEVFNGESTAVYEGRGLAFDALLTHMRFRFDPAWVDHYRLANLSRDRQSEVLCTALGYTAFITPMLIALFLLLASKGIVAQRVVNLDRINRIRRHAGKAELLEHVDAFTTFPVQRDGARPVMSHEGVPHAH